MNSITRIMSARLSGCLLAWLLAGPVQASLLLLDVTADRVNYSSLQGAAGAADHSGLDTGFASPGPCLDTGAAEDHRSPEALPVQQRW